jgi:hypothetical protein
MPCLYLGIAHEGSMYTTEMSKYYSLLVVVLKESPVEYLPYTTVSLHISDLFFIQSFILDKIYSYNIYFIFF